MSLTKNTIGVYVQAGNFNALEAVLEYLKKENIPVNFFDLQFFTYFVVFWF